jgi:hypothetical protein
LERNGPRLHTHGPDGVIHLHTAFPELITLGQFFDVWRVRLTDTCLGPYCAEQPGTLRVYVNGDLLPGNPRDVVIRPRDEVAVVFGPPGVPALVPSSYDFPPDLEQFGSRAEGRRRAALAYASSEQTIDPFRR